MPRSKLVTITDTKIEIPEEYHTFMPKDYLLVITKPFSTQYAIIDIYSLRVLQNTIQRKSIVSTILLALSEQTNTNNGKTKKPKKNGNEVKEPPKITMLNFIKKKVVVVQQTQLQPQSQNQPSTPTQSTQ